MRKFDNYCHCLNVLKSCNMETAQADEVYRMGVIGQFNLCFELAWKALREAMILHGVPGAETGSPRETLRLAFKVGFISDDEIWLDMLQSSNIITHVYGEAEACRLLTKISSSYIIAFEHLRLSIAEKIAE